jgi:ADP-L-glycero-D-manno-heptose 6-epimerase
MPENIRIHYQNFTQADMSKLRTVGFMKRSTSLVEGVRRYLSAMAV